MTAPPCDVGLSQKKRRANIVVTIKYIVFCFAAGTNYAAGIIVNTIMLLLKILHQQLGRIYLDLRLFG